MILQYLYDMNRRLLLILLPALLAGGCARLELPCTDDTSQVVPSGGTSSLTDPGLAWSESSFTAYLGVVNSGYPTLSNEYGVEVVFASSNTSVATISASGAITLVGEGETVISASSEEDDTYREDSASFTLTVCKSAAGLAWSAEEVSIVIGEDFTLPSLSNPYGLEISYSSSDVSIAAIDADGEVEIIADGSVVILAESEETDFYDAGSVSYILNITKTSDGISWSASSATVTLGASDNVFPELNNPGGQQVAYSSSNTGVASIDGTGAITLLSAGETTITAKSEALSTGTVEYESLTVSYSLIVQEEGSSLASAGLSWPSSSYTATMGVSFTSPELSNPNGLSVSYSSSDESVATISSGGIVTLAGPGTTTITATSAATDKYLAGSAFYTLTVSLADAGIDWSASICNATFGSENSFPTLANPAGLSVEYTSSNEDVATVDASGNPTLVASGTTYIKASFSGDGIYAQSSAVYTLKVSKGTPVLSWSAESFTAVLEDGSWDFPTLVSDVSGLEYTYTSSNESVAEVSSDGVPAPLAVGTTVISASSVSTQQYRSASASYTLTVKSSADDGAVTTVFDSSGSSDEDDISGTTFTRLVTVEYSASGAVVSGYSAVADLMQVSVSGAHVTITYSGNEFVAYKLSGTSSNGSFKLYSTRKQALWLSSLTLTNPSGAPINNQSGKRTFVYLEGTNTLADGSSAAYSSTGDEDLKGVLFSEGQLIFSGPSAGTGVLSVTANNAQSKSGIVSDDYVRMLRNASVSVSCGTGAGHGVKANDYVQISNGTLDISVKAAMKKGITSDNYVLVDGGTATITVTGGVAYDSEDAEYTGTAGIKADNYFGMTGGTVTITNTGSGGKGVRAGNYSYYSANNNALADSYVSGGTLTVKTSGSESNDVSTKAIKIGFKQKSGSSYIYAGNFNVSGGSIVATCSKSETIEVKGALTVSGGSVYAYSTGDDAINSQGELNITGGYVYGYSTANDAIDTNCDFKISGGYVFAITTKGSPEVALDANTEGGYKLYINSGATVVAYGGLESGYSASQTVYSMSCTAGSWNALHNGSSYIAAFKAPSGCSSVAVSAPSLSKGYTGVSVSGTTYCNANWATAGISGGSAVSLSTYSGGSGGHGGGGSGGGGGGRPGGW